MDEKKSENKSMNHALMQIGEMVQMIQNLEGPINVNPELIKELDGLKEAFALINEVTEKLVEKAGLKDEMSNSDDLSDRNKPLLVQRAKTIEKDARTLKTAYSKALEREQDQEPSKPPTPESIERSQKRRERRKLFKPLGGDKTWIPL